MVPRPRLSIGPLVDEPGLADDLAALWLRVTRAGGAVGFVVDSPAADVADVAHRTLAAAVAGELHGVALVEDAVLLGVGFLDPQRGPVVGHRATVVRLMIDPARHRGGLGSLVLDALVERARSLGLTQLLLDAREGTGAPEFYLACGWTECGCVVAGRRGRLARRRPVLPGAVTSAVTI